MEVEDPVEVMTVDGPEGMAEVLVRLVIIHFHIRMDTPHQVDRLDMELLLDEEDLMSHEMYLNAGEKIT